VCKTGGVEQRQRTLRPEKSCRSDEGRGFDSRHLHSRFSCEPSRLRHPTKRASVGAASRRPQSADRLAVARAVDGPLCMGTTRAMKAKPLTRPASAAEVLKLVDKGGPGVGIERGQR
jgi:hypothetical protein